MSFEGEMAYSQLLCYHFTHYILVKKGILYVFPSKQHFLHHSNQPTLFYNLSHTVHKRTANTILISSGPISLELSHQHPEIVDSFILALQPQQIDVEAAFPKKFQEIEEQKQEKIACEGL